MTLEQLKTIIDKHFGSPFLDAGLVQAEIVSEAGELMLDLKIGRRDVRITAAGEVAGAGTTLY